uniref:Uncharacterized protein n=1 Tax=Ditylenchus dipsaci TaxID=166011 RepID=A0A915DE44_9BILA
MFEGNVDDDFDALASHSAALFSEKESSRTESPVSSSSHTSFSSYNVSVPSTAPAAATPSTTTAQRFDRTPKKPSISSSALKSTNEDNQLRASKRRKKNVKQIVEDPEIKRYIGQLTREYRERLKNAIASGMPLSDGLLRGETPEMRLTLPADLSADNWNWLLTSDDSHEEAAEESQLNSENSGWLPTTSTSLQAAIGQPAASTPSPTNQSPSSAQASANFFAVVGGEETTAPNPPSPLQFDSLFNSGNPIWKPIFEDIPSSYWPSGFDQLGKEKPKKSRETNKSISTVLFDSNLKFIYKLKVFNN